VLTSAGLSMAQPSALLSLNSTHLASYSPRQLEEEEEGAGACATFETFRSWYGVLCVCVCVIVRERESKNVCVCVCVHVCVCVWERERERECVCVCECVCECIVGDFAQLAWH